MDPGNRIIGGRGAIDSFLSYTLPALSSYTVAMAFLSVVLFLTEKHEGTPFDRSKRSLGWLKRSITSTDTMMQRVVLLLTIFPSNVTVQRFACSSVTSLLLADAIGWSRVLSAFVGSDGFALVLRGMSAHPESIELQLAGSDVIVTCCYLDSNVGARIVSLGGLDVLYAALLSHQSLCEKLAAGFASLIPSADVMAFLLSKTMGGDAEDIIRRAMIDTVTSYIGFRVTRDHKNRVKSTTHFSIRPLIHQLLGVASKYTTHQGMCLSVLSLLQTVFMDVNPVTQHPVDLVEKANSLIEGGGLKALMMVMSAHQDSPKALLSCLLTMSMIVRAEDEIKGGSPGITLTPALLNAGVMTVWMGLLRSHAEHEDIVMEACLCISLLLFHCDSASTQQYVREGVITLMCAAMRRFNQSVRLATLCTSTFRNVWVSVGEGKKDFRAMFDDMLSNGCLTVSLFAMASFPVHEHPAFQLRGCMAVAAISKLYGSTVIAAGGLQAVYDIMDVIDPLENLRLCETTFIALESMALSDLSVGRCADRIIATGGLQRVHRISRELPVATETLTANGYACCALAAIGVRAQGAGIDIVEMGVIRFIAEMLTDLRFRLDDDVDVMFDESYLPDEFESVCGAVCTLMLRSQSFTPFTAGFSFVGPIVSALAGHANHPILSECCSSALMHMCVHAEYRDVIGSNPAAIPALVKAHDTNGCSLATLVHLSTSIYRAAIIATHSYRADTAVKISDEMQQHPYTVTSTCHPHPLRATILSRKM